MYKPRTCPKCGVLMEYKTPSGYRYGIMHNSICNKCLGISQRKPRVNCKQCRHFLGKRNKSGYCNDCYIIRNKKQVKERKTYHCPRCGEDMTSKQNEVIKRCKGRGYCYKCLEKEIALKGLMIIGKCAICGIPINRKYGKKDTNYFTKKVRYFCSDACGYWIKLNDLIDRIKHHHKDRYDYSKMLAQLSANSSDWSKIKYSVECKNHGTFMTTPRNFSNGRGCPRCQVSKGERLIIEYLDKHKIPYVHQKKFFDCRGVRGGPLKFDFYIPIVNTLIEFDGQQHYRHAKIRNHILTPQELERVQQHDKIKTDYAASKKMPLIRIRYSKIKSVDSILDKVMC